MLIQFFFLGGGGGGWGGGGGGGEIRCVIGKVEVAYSWFATT